MIEPPSSHLVQTLIELKLCSASNLRKCRGRVKRLARDLPAFDSVWVDALLQARHLTPFQASLLAGPDSHRLCVGPCVLVDRLGNGKASETYLARQRDGNERCTLKLVSVCDDMRDGALSRLEELVARTQSDSHPSIVAPRVAMTVDERIALVSRYVPGPHLAGLLVRRGRIPPHIVTEIAAQLIDGLARFEQLGVVHGDLQLTNVRLTAHGAAVLVDFGVKPAVSPEFNIHSALRADRCEGIAPELIGTTIGPTSTSDIYALGCMLWHLLAGRPPYMTADPLAKLACHQTKRILDVREIAPDVPAVVAEAVRAFTSPDPRDRPQTFGEVRDRWKTPRRAGRKRLAEFSAGFNTAARRIQVAAREHSSNKWPFMLVLLFVLSGASLTLLDKGKLTLPLSIREMATKYLPEPKPEEEKTKPGEKKSESVKPLPKLVDLPQPDAEGVVRLESDGPYRARKLEAVGFNKLTLRGAPDRQPVVIVDAEPMPIVASQFVVENVHFRRERVTEPAGSQRATLPLIKVRSQNFVIQNCSFVLEGKVSHGLGWAAASDAGATLPTMIDWKALDDTDASAVLITLQNTVFLGHVPAVSLNSVPQKLQATNCLKVGAGTFLTLAQPPKPQQTFHSDLKQLTLRESDGFLSVRMPDTKSQAGLISADTTGCVFHLPAADATFVEFVASGPPEGANLRVEVVGQGSLANRAFDTVRWVDAKQQQSAVLESEAIFLEGILTDRFEFLGRASREPGNAAVKQQGSTTPPGIDSTLLRSPTI